MARILVIDDDSELLEMIRLLLERRRGHEAILSADGEEGVTRARQDPPDLAIVDVMMPGMTGYDVCRELRKYPETESIPILVLTARGQPVDRKAALEAGADQHMAKPIAMADLIEKIDNMLAQRSASETSRTVTLLSLKGGVGVTTLAVNVAATLAREEDKTVCLVDLSPSSGHAALQFGLRPQPDWSTLVEEGVGASEDVEPLLLEPAPGLHLLASPVLPLVERALPGSTVEAVLEILRLHSDIVVVDTPSILNEATMAALDAASHAWLVVAADSASVQSAFGTVGALGELSARLGVVLNQFAPARRPSSEAIERVLRRPVSGVVPFDPDQAQALAQGQPLALSAPDSPLATAIAKLTDDLA